MTAYRITSGELSGRQSGSRSVRGGASSLPYSPRSPAGAFRRQSPQGVFWCTGRDGVVAAREARHEAP